MLPWLFVCTLTAASAPIYVAVTVDDLPGSGANLMTIGEVLRQYGVPQVVGYASGFMLRASPGASMRALRDWVAAGHGLGNHTFSHGQLERWNVADYCADIDRNEWVLREATGGASDFHTFRFPYLQQGATAPQRDAVRAHLQARGYRVAEVTLDTYDFAWDKPFQRCLILRDSTALEAIRRAFLADAVGQLQWADNAAREVFGRSIKHIMLMHSRGITAAYLGEILQAFVSAGVVFVPVSEALADPAYQIPLERQLPARGNFISRVIGAYNVHTVPRSLPHPEAWMAAQCPMAIQEPSL